MDFRYEAVVGGCVLWTCPKNHCCKDLPEGGTLLPCNVLSSRSPLHGRSVRKALRSYSAMADQKGKGLSMVAAMIL